MDDQSVTGDEFAAVLKAFGYEDHIIERMTGDLARIEREKDREQARKTAIILIMDSVGYWIIGAVIQAWWSVEDKKAAQA